MYLETAAWEMVRPSFTSSPCTRELPKEDWRGSCPGSTRVFRARRVGVRHLANSSTSNSIGGGEKGGQIGSQEGATFARGFQGKSQSFFYLVALLIFEVVADLVPFSTATDTIAA